MITRIEAYKYRCFDKLDIKVGQYQVLAGANGSGKSTLLDIPLLLGDILTRGLTPTFLEPSLTGENARAKSFQELIYYCQGNYFTFVVEAELPEEIKRELLDFKPLKINQTPNNYPHKLRYEIRLEIFNQVELQVANEFLYIVPRDSKEPVEGWVIGEKRPQSWYSIIERETGNPASIKAEYQSGSKKEQLRLEPQELALANIPRDLSQFPATAWFRDLLEKEVMHYHPDWQKLRQASPPGQTKTLREDAANLPWIVINLQESEPDLFEAWVDHVKMALPNLVNIEGVRREEDFHAYLKVTYAGDYMVTSSGLSVGTLQILALTILPYLNNLPKLIFLDEPENHIHPRAIEVILQSLSSLYDSQLWISTHSPTVLAHTDLDAVIVMQKDRNNGSKAILGSQHPRLTDWQGSIDLGSLFAAGVLS